MLILTSFIVAMATNFDIIDFSLCSMTNNVKLYLKWSSAAASS